SHKPQRPVEFQLAVVLYRLGGKASVWDTASKFGIAEGSVMKQQVHNGFQQMYRFPNVIDIIDNSYRYINLLKAPIKTFMYTRKRRYAIHLQEGTERSKSRYI
ncbi:7806_t:CDS:2, partial [Scutellospora calospora]